MLPLHSGPTYTAVFGFSDKAPYDLFCANSNLHLKPYPLTKFYLRDKLAINDETVRLIAIDASSPRDAHLSAITIESLLEALESKTELMSVAYRLSLDQKSDGYKVEKASLESGLQSQSHSLEYHPTIEHSLDSPIGSGEMNGAEERRYDEH